jgi:glycosyltransferase involved in cell wall biosynthesis
MVQWVNRLLGGVVTVQQLDNVAVVIPAYNEAATICDVAGRVLGQCKQVIVVDDGSDDDTVARLDGLPVTVLRNPCNAGKAASLWRGMCHALEHGAQAVITLDGDGQHDANDIPRLLAAATVHPSAIIIAARLKNRDTAPKARLFANNFADFWISWAAGQWVHDSQSGFRLYPAELLRGFTPRKDRRYGFVFESEVLILGIRRGFPSLSVPIASVYSHDGRPSHFRPVADISLIVRMVAWKLFTRGMFLPGLWRALRTRKQGIVSD